MRPPVSRGVAHHRRSFYERLIAAAKPKKVALIPCARKLLTILNAMVRNTTRWMAPAIERQHSC